MFHMDQLIRSRKVIRDVTYRWIPFLFVVLTVVVSTALLSTSGRPPRGIVVTFGVLAGLLVVIFLACHLMMYCTRINHEMDTERAGGAKDDADPSENIPLGFISKDNIGTQARQQQHERPELHGPGRDEQRRLGQPRPNNRMSSNVPNRSSAARYNPSTLSQVAAYSPDQSQFQNPAEDRVSQDQPPTVPDQRPMDSTWRRVSAVPAPLRPRRQAQTQSTQLRPQRGLGPSESPLHLPISQVTSAETAQTLHSARTSARTDAAQRPPPHESTPRQHTAALGDTAAPRQWAQQDPLANGHRGGGTDELHYVDTRESHHGTSAFTSPPGPQAGALRRRRAETSNTVHARLALVGGPDVWGLVSRFLPDTKPGARLRRMSADDCLRRPPWGGGDVDDDDDAELVVARDVGCRVVRVVHPTAAAPGLGRVQSLKGSVRVLRARDSRDSGYYSAAGVQNPPLQTRSWATAGSATSVSSLGSTWPSTSSGSPLSSSSSSARSELFGLRPRSASSTASELMGLARSGEQGRNGKTC